MKKFLVSYDLHGELFGGDVLARDYSEAEKLAREKFGDTAIVKGTLVMAGDCGESDVEGLTTKLRVHCLKMNAKNI